MAPRKRKVVVATTNAPEVVKFATAVIQTVLSAQQSETTHAKLVKQLKQLYPTVQHDSFMKSFIQVIKRQMEHDETNTYANNVLKFCAKFVADPAFSEQPITHPIMASIFDWLLTTISSVRRVRFRICQLVNLILNALGTDAALDDTICDKILRYMLERIRDASQDVRVQAVLALQRLQDPGSPEDPVVRAYVYHLDKDPSPKVRQAIISSLGRNYRLIPYILERLWDADEKVRRHTYMQMSCYPVRQYKIDQRLKFLEQGLNDHSEAVRDVMRNVMIPQWIESYQRDYIAFVGALKLDADEKEMERFRKAAKTVLMEIFKKKGVEEMACLLNFKEDNSTVPLEELTIERLICWQTMLEYLQQNDSDELERYMVELSKFCEYLKGFVTNPNAAAFMKAANLSTESNQISSPGQPDTMDKLQQLYVQCSLQILLEIVLMFDFCDEFGRDNLKQLLSDILCNENLSELNVRLIMETFEKLITDVDTRLNFFVELVSSILEPSRQDVSNSSRQLIDAYLEKHPEMTSLKLQISALRVKILELKEQESALSARKDYAGAQLVNEKVNQCNEEYANLVKPLVQEMSMSATTIEDEAGNTTSTTTTTSTTLQFRESVLKPRRVTQATVEKCLQICFYLVNSPTVSSLTPPVCSLYPTFISRYVQSGQLATRNWALRTATAFSMLYDGLSKETFQLLYQQFLNTASSRLWKTAFECVFELLDMYGFEYFDLESEDSQKDDSRTMKSSRQLFSRHSSSFHDDSTHSSCNGNEFYKMSVHFMDTCNDSAICSAIIDGFCRLILRGRCSSADIMSKLLLRYFNPTTEPEMQQMLGIFFQGLIAKRRQELMQKALLSTLFLVLEAPSESPLAEIQPESVIKFVVDSTRPVFCNPGVNPHNTIAVTFLRVMRDNITLKDLLKLLSKELLVLDIKEDTGLRVDLANAVGEILNEPSLDAKTIKNLTTFREMMLGKIQETITFSSSRIHPSVVDGDRPDTPGTEETNDEEPVVDEEEEENVQEPNEDAERSDYRQQINKSILQEDSDTDLLASPMKQPGAGAPLSPAMSPARTNNVAPGPPDSGVKSLRRSLLPRSPMHDLSTDGKFKVPDASTLLKMQAASARVRVALSSSKMAISNPAQQENDFEIPSTNDAQSSDERGFSSTSEDELEIPETQESARSNVTVRQSTASTRTSARTSRTAAANKKSSSSSSDSEAVEGSPNSTLIRINRAARPLNKVAAKTLVERKQNDIPGTLPRTTRHTARLETMNSKVMTRKSLSELSSPNRTVKTTTKTAPTATTRPSRRSKNATEPNKPSPVVSTKRIPNNTTVPDNKPAPVTSSKRIPNTTVSNSPKLTTRTSARTIAAASGPGQQSSSPSGSKRLREPRSSTVTPTNEQSSGKLPVGRKVSSGSGSSGVSTSSPIRLKRAAVVLTPLSAIRRTDRSNHSTPLATSPRRPNRKATRTEKA
uniref:Nuclear condensin complex subunit 3 C-terminal domain-containing protein n=1 Tax=Anopheles culicifacies TaxID=139723 RepID=A0A182M4E0_9DIPT